MIGIYALVSPPPTRLAMRGVAGERLRAVSIGGITAVVGEMTRPPAPTMANLKRHAAAIDAIALVVPAILPARFGSSVTDRDELRVVIAARAVALKPQLRHVRSRVQMTIRLFRPESGGDPSGDADSHDESSPDSHLGDGATRGTRYLRRRVAADARLRDVKGFAPVRAAVRRFVRDERVEQRAGVATVHHLIPRRSVDAYRGALERAAGGAGLRMLITGPFAPFAFADNW